MYEYSGIQIFISLYVVRIAVLIPVKQMLRKKGNTFQQKLCIFGVHHARRDTLLLNSLQEWILPGFSNLPDFLVHSPSIYREVKADARWIDLENSKVQ